jgi:hypothetical protein
MIRPAFLVSLLFSTLPCAYGQWVLHDAHTTADLRGIHSLGNGVAWASGTNGTVLRTTDDGKDWQHCAIPSGAEKLDFRGIQGFDENTAIVMSSGTGELSRLYKTTDGCQSWKLVLTNPDGNGFFDAIKMSPPISIRADRSPVQYGMLIGDPVDEKFVEYQTKDNGDHWERLDGGEAGMPSARNGESLFAASNSSLLYEAGAGLFVTGGISGSRSRVLSEYVKHDPRVSWKYVGGELPLASGAFAGAFSIAIAAAENSEANNAPHDQWTLLYAQKGALVAVGGDYKKPQTPKGTAAFSADSGLHWQAAQIPPHGYRSAVAYDEHTKTWVTVGSNGTDISTDDGRSWRPLTPSAKDALDADKNWNALSLPFVVGPKGRIGRLNSTALAP